MPDVFACNDLPLGHAIDFYIIRDVDPVVIAFLCMDCSSAFLCMVREM